MKLSFPLETRKRPSGNNFKALASPKCPERIFSSFVTRFEKLDKNDLKIKGTFSEFNNYTDIAKMTNEDLNNSMIEKKLSNTSNSVLDSYIVKSLENDVAFKFNRKKK